MNRRAFGTLLLAAAASPLIAKRAFAMPFAEYQPDAFLKLLASGNPIVVHVHADWCSVCRAQMPVMERVLAGAPFKKVHAVRVNFDREKRFLADYKVVRQSTVIVFKDGKEIARLSYDADPQRIEQTLAHAIT